MYGYQNDEVSVSGLSFGLNQGVKMIEFGYNPNCGKDGSEMEGLDIVFQVEDRKISYRQFPVKKVFVKGVEITDANHPAMRVAFNDFSALMTHIMLCFVPLEDYKNALSKPTNSFKEFCETLKNILPKDFAEKELDLFAQYQFKIKGENTQTYLEIPRNLKHGKFLCATIPSTSGWQAVAIPDPSDSLKMALYYKDGNDKIHPFTRTGWFMNSPFAKKQTEEGAGAVANALGFPTSPTTDSDNGGSW